MTKCFLVLFSTFKLFSTGKYKNIFIRPSKYYLQQYPSMPVIQNICEGRINTSMGVTATANWRPLT